MSKSFPSDSQGGIVIPDPPLVKDLFGNTRWAWLWVIPRLYVGYT